MSVDGTTSQKRRVFIEWEDEPGQSVIFDATQSEDHESESDITDNPVEVGVDNTDHIQRLPNVLILDAVVTDDPLIENRSTSAEPANTGGDPNQRAISAYNWLIQTKDQAKFLRVFTKLRTYRNMVIQSLKVTRSAEESRIIRAIITLREIRVAVTEQVDAPKPRLKTKRKRTKQGKKTTIEESEANKTKAREFWTDVEDDRSALLKIVGG